MARTTKTRRAAPRSTPRTDLQPRELLLAGLGALSLGRKQAIKSYAEGYEGLADLRSRAEAAVQEAVENVNGQVVDLRKTVKNQVAGLRKQAKAKVAPVQKKVVALATEARAQAETRLAPVLAKLGVKKASRRPAVKRASKRVTKAVGKRTRKAA